MKKLVHILLLSLLCATIFFAQEEEKKSIKQKLKNLKGAVESVTIKTDEAELKFTGDEAADLYKKMKMSANLMWIDELDGETDHDFFILDKLKETDIKLMLSKECCSETEDGKTVKLKVERNEDGLKVTEIITENGKKTEKTYEGEEAEKILEKRNKHRKHSFFISDDDEKVFTITKEFFGDEGTGMKIDINEEDGETTVKVVTIEDGEEVVKTYKGEEADKFLKEHKSKHKILIETDEDTDADVFIIKEGDHSKKNKIFKWKSKDGSKKIIKKLKKLKTKTETEEK